MGDRCSKGLSADLITPKKANLSPWRRPLCPLWPECNTDRDVAAQPFCNLHFSSFSSGKPLYSISIFSQVTCKEFNSLPLSERLRLRKREFYAG